MLSIALISSVFLLSALYARKLLGSWMHPGSMLFLLWTSVFVSTTVFAPDYYFSFVGGLFLYALVSSFFLGGLLGSYSAKNSMRGTRPITELDFSIKRLDTILVSGTLCGFVAVMYVLATQGVSVASFSDIDELAETAHDFSVARYEDDYRMPVVARLLLSLNYVAISFSGLVVGAGHTVIWRRQGFLRRALLLVPLLPQVVLAVVMTTRAQVLFEMIVWMSFYFSGAIYAKDRRIHSVFSLKKIFFISVLVFLVGALFVFLQFLRGGITDLNRVWEILEHLRKWPFGSVAGFSIWVDGGKGGQSISFGAYTFAGFFDLVGIKSRETGLFVDYVDLGGGAYGNIYTAFRGVLEDWGYAGGVFSLLLAGYVGGYSYTTVLKGARVSYIGLLAAIFMGLAWSPIVSFYAYFSVIFNIVLVSFLLPFLTRVRVLRRSL